MSNDQNVQTSSAPLPQAAALKVDIKTAIDSAQRDGSIRVRVINKLVETEISSRVDVLSKALAKREDKQKEIDGLKADHKLRDVTGKIVSEAFTDTQFKKREKLQKELAKMDKVINQAINEGNYEGAKKLAGGSLKVDDSAEGGDDSSGDSAAA